MNEISRFARFVMPGLSATLTFTILYFVTDRQSLTGFLSVLLEKEGIIAAVVALLGSGVLGFTFSQIYFAIDCCPLRKVDHLETMERLRRNDSLAIMDVEGRPVRSLSKREAWDIVSNYLLMAESNPTHKRMADFTRRLTDIMHSLGAVIVGNTIALLLWLPLFYGGPEHEFWWHPQRDTLAVLITFLLMILPAMLTRHTLLVSLERIGDSEFATCVMDCHTHTGKVETVYFMRQSIKPDKCWTWLRFFCSEEKLCRFLGRGNQFHC